MATQVTERYCPICGKAVADATHNRFGEWCCGDVHAEEYVAEARSKKQRELASADRLREAQRGPIRHRGQRFRPCLCQSSVFRPDWLSSGLIRLGGSALRVLTV